MLQACRGLAVAALVVLQSAPSPAAEPVAVAHGTMRVTGRWGDARLVTGAGVRGAAVSPDGKRLAAISQLGTYVWDLATGTEVRLLPQPLSYGSRAEVRFGAPGTVVSITDKELVTWDLATGLRRSTIALQGFGTADAAISPQTNQAAIWEAATFNGHPGKLEVWDLATAKQLRAVANARIDEARFVAGGRRLVGTLDNARGTAYGYETTTVWDAATGALLFANQTAPDRGYGGQRQPTTIWVAEDGRHVVRTFASEPSVELVDLDHDAKQVLAHPKYDGRPVSAADGKTVAFWTGDKGDLEVWDVERPARRAAFRVDPQDLGELQLSSTGELLIVHGPAHFTDDLHNPKTWIALYRTRDGRRLWRKNEVYWRHRVAAPLEADDRLGVVLYANWYPESTSVRLVGWRAENGAQFLDTIGTLNRRSWFLGADRLVVADSTEGFDLRRTDDWKPALAPDRATGRVVKLAVSSDGRTVATVGEDGTILVRDLGGKTAPLQRLPNGGAVEDLAFVPGRPELVVAHYARAYRWDLAERRVLSEARSATLPKVPPWLSHAKLYDDGARVAFASSASPLELRALDGDRRIEQLPRWCGGQTHNLDAVDLSGRGVCFASQRKTKARALLALRGAAIRRGLGPGGSPRMLTISPDGRHALLGTYQGVELAAIDGHGPTRALEGIGEFLAGTAFSRDGRRAFVASSDGTVSVYDPGDGKLLDTVSFLPELDLPTALAVGADGRTLMVGTSRGLVYRLESAAP